MNLFERGNFQLHSGQQSDFRIECDALTDQDWATLAYLVAERVGPFGQVEGVPDGGLYLAAELEPYATEGELLIVDDVLTSGGSMEAHRDGRIAIGAVIFARSPCPTWISPLFQMSEPWCHHDAPAVVDGVCECGLRV